MSARKIIYADGFDLEDQRGNEFVLVLVLVLVLDFPACREIFSRTRTRTRTKAKLKTKKPSLPQKRGMKAFNESAQKWFGRLAPSFSLRRSAPNRSGLTSAIKPVS
jgi:hypothetical protein